MLISCPFCKQKSTWEENPWRPFCSERCKMIDLGKWAMEDYKIPGENLDQSSPEEKEDVDRREK